MLYALYSEMSNKNTTASSPFCVGSCHGTFILSPSQHSYPCLAGKEQVAREVCGIRARGAVSPFPAASLPLLYPIMGCYSTGMRLGLFLQGGILYLQGIYSLCVRIVNP
jgi:hypothetical protein